MSTYKGTREKAYFLSKKGRRFIQSRYSLPDVTQLIVLQKILLLNNVLLQVIHWCFNRKVPILSLITEAQASADTFFEESKEPRGIDARLLIEWEGEEYFFTFQAFPQWLDFNESYDRLRLLQDSLLFGYPERKNVEYGEYGYNQQLLAYPNSCAVVLGKNDGIVEQLKNYLMELNIERRGIIDYFLIENYQAFLDSFYEKLLSSSEN
ncbi:hypothetical protein HQ633_11415 [Enterococcus faecium]|nr:hypothetical protein [Enterococcus faecium]